jgi:hypothetical protein
VELPSLRAIGPCHMGRDNEVSELACNYVFHVDKQEFLTIYTRIRPIVFTKQIIKSGFEATGLIPYCPDRVLSSLTVV